MGTSWSSLLKNALTYQQNEKEYEDRRVAWCRRNECRASVLSMLTEANLPTAPFQQRIADATMPILDYEYDGDDGEQDIHHITIGWARDRQTPLRA